VSDTAASQGSPRDADALQPDVRSDSAPAAAAPFSGRRRSGTAGGGGASSAQRKPPRGPLSGWRSSSEAGRSSRSSGSGGARGLARSSYKRSMSAQHLPQVRGSPFTRLNASCYHCANRLFACSTTLLRQGSETPA
jgi:hypothetical protein